MKQRKQKLNAQKFNKKVNRLSLNAEEMSKFKSKKSLEGSVMKLARAGSMNQLTMKNKTLFNMRKKLPNFIDETTLLPFSLH